jgi:hypothetical protein
LLKIERRKHMGMKRITQEELEVFLRKHKLWMIGDQEGERADLTDANLYGADLTDANLYGADLTDANLYGANLYGANLTRADLTDANLYGANLTRADLYGANLTRADLTDANLYGADLTRANLYGANLTRADLTDANLYGADLTDANLYGANLYGADLKTATNVNYPIACPEKGSFTAFKKVRGNYIVELEIPADALRSSATSRKCRCSKAKVVSITSLDGSPADVDAVYSKHDMTFVYKVGETVCPDSFDPDRWNECAPGIHFFITRQEAVNY